MGDRIGGGAGQEHEREERSDLGPAYADATSQKVPDAQRRQEYADEAAPDVDGVPKVWSDHAAGHDLQGEQDPSARKDDQFEDVAFPLRGSACARAALRTTISSPLASTTTVSPSRSSPARSWRLIGFSTERWINRRSGLAPKSGLYPSRAK